MRVEKIKKKISFKKWASFTAIMILLFSFISIPCQCLTVNNDVNAEETCNKTGEDFSVTIHKIKQHDEIDPLPHSYEGEWQLNIYINDVKKTLEFVGEEVIIDTILVWPGIVEDGMKFVKIKMELKDKDLGMWPDEDDIADISANVDLNYENGDYDDTDDFDSHRPAVFKQSYKLMNNDWEEPDNDNDFIKIDDESPLPWFITSGNYDGSTAIDENDVSLWFDVHVGNHPPYIPEKPTGANMGWIGEVYEFSTQSYDPDGDLIQFGWDWNGDDIIDELTGFYDSWEKVYSLHSWDIARIYYIKVKAIDINGFASEWSEEFKLEINGPYGKSGFEVEEWSLGRIYCVYLDHYETMELIDILRGGGNIVTAVATLISAIAAAAGIPLDISISIAIVTAILRIGVEVLNLMDRGMGVYMKVYMVLINDWPITQFGYIWSQDSLGDEDKPPDDNVAPSKPIITSGPEKGKPGGVYEFSTVTTDQNDDMITYIFSWGHDNFTCSELMESGEEFTATHSWEKEGGYCVRVKVLDIYGFESEWSEPITIIIKENKGRYLQFFNILHNLFSFLNIQI